jgi:uncharacterized DUF497 family protein
MGSAHAVTGGGVSRRVAVGTAPCLAKFVPGLVVAFEDARLVWGDPNHILPQDRHEAGEERWQIMGYARGVVILVVWQTDPNDQETVRTIGARKAERSERRAYEQGI